MWTQISIFVLFYLIVAAMGEILVFVAAMVEILVFVTAMVGCKGFVAVCGGFCGGFVVFLVGFFFFFFFKSDCDVEVVGLWFGFGQKF